MAITYHAPRRRPYPAPSPSPRRRSTEDADVVVDMDDGTMIRTTVTSSAYYVALFLREVQARFQEEVREYEKGQEQQGRPEEEDRQHCLVVGLDTEWHQTFDEDGKPRHQIAVLQLCVADRCLVYQVFHADYIPAELACFLADPAFCFVAVGVGGDVKRLREDCNLEVAHTMDLPQVAAAVLRRPDLRQSGLKTLAREVMGTLVEKPKTMTLSRWAAEGLSAAQVKYACIDAFVSFDVGRRLLCEPRA